MKKFFLFSLFILASSLVVQAQMPKFYEVTSSFFDTNKSYHMKSFMLVMLGIDGISYYDKGDAFVKISKREIVVKFEDGSGHTNKIVGGMQNCTVHTSNGDVVMPMYKLNDGTAIRAIQYENGEYALHCYIYNINMEKYLHQSVYTLYKD